MDFLLHTIVRCMIPYEYSRAMVRGEYLCSECILHPVTLETFVGACGCCCCSCACVRAGGRAGALQIMKGAAFVVDELQRGIAVLVHCSDGWDRTAQLTALAQVSIK